MLRWVHIRKYCAESGETPDAAEKRVRKPPGPPSVAATVPLPRDDGRVHVIDIPGRHEVARCLVHVGPTGSSMTCLPVAEDAPTEWEPERP